ncbi:fimbrial protein [Acinetobacter calcoaceticus]|uniref:fimbrial protein n=1 Tax=Acinetobacter calcoaceticus TaxID=471 RepID=UPI00192C2BA3|nr:fimbrial protein [Acinetobacter calcoaceticus]
MDFRNLMLTMLVGLGAVLGSQQGFAEVYACSQNGDSNLSPGNSSVTSVNVVELEPGGYWGTLPISQIDAPDHFKCEDAIPGKIIEAKEVTSRNLSIYFTDLTSDTVTYSGKTYVKMRYSDLGGSKQAIYVYYEVSEIGSSDRVPLLGAARMDPLNIKQYDALPNIGISIHNLQFLFTSKPTVADILFLTVRSSFNFKVGLDSVQTNSNRDFSGVAIALVPPSVTTCNVNSETINIPPVLASKLNTIGSTSGDTQFAITAICPVDVINKTLEYKIIDNYMTGSKLSPMEYLTVFPLDGNGGIDRSIGVILEEVGGGVVETNTDYPFGTLPAGQTKLQKSFVAKYKRKESGEIRLGHTTSQASVLVQYK